MQLGADACLQTSVLGQPEDVAAELRRTAGAPDGFEVVIDCAGFQQTMQVGPGGRAACQLPRAPQDWRCSVLARIQPAATLWVAPWIGAALMCISSPAAYRVAPALSTPAQVAMQACADGGRIVLVGMGQEQMTLGLVEACIREVDIVGSFR